MRKIADVRVALTVFSATCQHFTDLSHELSPLKVSQMLDRLYLAFDLIAKKHSGMYAADMNSATF